MNQILLYPPLAKGGVKGSIMDYPINYLMFIIALLEAMNRLTTDHMTFFGVFE